MGAALRHRSLRFEARPRDGVRVAAAVADATVRTRNRRKERERRTSMPPMGPEAKKQLRTAMRLGAAGLELGGSIFVGVLVGFWLDKKYGTAPWLALIGLLLGSAIGFRALFWILRNKSDTPGSNGPSARPPGSNDSAPHD